MLGRKTVRNKQTKCWKNVIKSSEKRQFVLKKLNTEVFKLIQKLHTFFSEFLRFSTRFPFSNIFGDFKHCIRNSDDSQQNFQFPQSKKYITISPIATCYRCPLFIFYSPEFRSVKMHDFRLSWSRKSHTSQTTNICKVKVTHSAVSLASFQHFYSIT